MSAVLDTLLESRKTAAQELETRRSGLMDELSGLVHDEDGKPRTLTEDDEARSTKILAEIDQIDAEINEKTKVIEKRIKAEAKRVKKEQRLLEARKDVAKGIGDTKVVSEPMVYGVDKDGHESPHSWYGDLCRRAMSQFTGTDGGAGQRLAEWAHQVEVEIAQDSQIGRQAEKQMRELVRDLGPVEAPKRLAEVRSRGRVGLDAKVADLGALDLRNVTSGGGATAATQGGGANGSAFVTPVFFVSSYAPYRELGRPFADQCNKQTLPEYGMSIYIPAVKQAFEVATQQSGSTGEGNAVNETAVGSGFGYLSGTLTTIAGDQFITQQLLDRAGPNFAFDKMIFDQLERNYARKFDEAVLTAALVNATEQNWAGTFALTAKEKAGGFVGQVAKSKGAMRALGGTILNPTHLFLTQNRWEFISAFADSQGRPLVNPQYAGPCEAAAAGSSDGDEGIEGYTGYRLAGLPVYQDGNISKSGTYTGTSEQEQAIVGCLKEVWVYEGPPVTRALPQTKGTELLVLLQRYSYYTVIKRYEKAVTVITGTAMQPVSYS